MNLPKGFNIREDKGDLELSVNVEQFSAWLTSMHKTSKGWVSLKIYKRDEVDPRGYSHNMIQVIKKHQPV